jgi:hypothetical protein
MNADQFINDAKSRIEHIGLTVGYAHTYVDGSVYVASLETAKGCLGHPKAEAQLYEDGRTFYTFNIRPAPAQEPQA